MSNILKRSRRTSLLLRPVNTRTVYLNSHESDPTHLIPDSEVVHGVRLLDTIVSDLLYGVQSRPSIPACWEDDSDDGVDPLTDMTVSPWDLMAADCRRKPSLRGYKPESDPGEVPVSDPLSAPDSSADS